jgi:hypothetical protein
LIKIFELLMSEKQEFTFVTFAFTTFCWCHYSLYMQEREKRVTWGEEGEIWRKLNPSQLRERFARPKVIKSRLSLSIEGSIRLYLRSSSESSPEQHSNGSHRYQDARQRFDRNTSHYATNSRQTINKRGRRQILEGEWKERGEITFRRKHRTKKLYIFVSHPFELIFRVSYRVVSLC